MKVESLGCAKIVAKQENFLNLDDFIGLLEFMRDNIVLDDFFFFSSFKFSLNYMIWWTLLECHPMTIKNGVRFITR